MEKVYILILSILFTTLVGMVGYLLKSIHKEVKQLIKELTDYTNKLKLLIVGIQTHIDKGIETDIQEIKEDIKSLHYRSNKNQSQIASLQQKASKSK